ncbi:hypothetical protein CACET_c15440 [Clostridium aceticum]|uniref:Uncharacterized protein n=1 Tax=Clostridium aceticum TaxID=84022 RepID=A0A0D8ICA1_9CLOT|nr:hypothetical protein [Clostridium aceticum]AKL94993.1 hypothetical protein CACET_c15440 [Clostridium aceticum]KJF27898.1 hypothetical protein TZ02_04785 [Clostridium aceticum]
MGIIGCCNDFKKCSDEAKCIKKDQDYILGEKCLYEENLKKGLNFYTTYNENNAARKREYELQIKDTVKELKTEIKSTKEARAADHNYICIDGRYFVIGKRSGYQGYTLFLEKDVREELGKLFRKLSVEFTDTPNEKLFIDEKWADDNPACYRAILCIGSEENRYNISNYNYRALTNSTARAIKAFLNDAGLSVMIETIGRGIKSTPNYNKQKTTQKVTPPTKAPKKEIVQTPSIQPAQQLSFEDLGLCI